MVRSFHFENQSRTNAEAGCGRDTAARIVPSQAYFCTEGLDNGTVISFACMQLAIGIVTVVIIMTMYFATPTYTVLCAVPPPPFPFS